MKAYILAIGKCKHGSPEAAIIAEYVKRSGWDVIIKEKEMRNENGLSFSFLTYIRK